ncbi:MAG: pyridoxal phosphate-dependent aminotransferase [Burkholderiales bacterium]|jgi:cystathionine beta-lyase|nr:pyridoxal phosphate-dependent aminotransferase [Burkholderiales bacterium]
MQCNEKGEEVKYDFDTAVDYRGANSLKHNFARERGKPEDVLPLWVADMDFAMAPEILADIQKRVAQGVLGYTEPKDDYCDALLAWFDSRLSYRAARHDIIKTPGVVFALVAAIRAFTSPNDAVMIQTPVYYPFYDIVRNNGRALVSNPLVYADGRYTIDLADFERKIIERDVKLFILCSPHNPVGRVWTRNELTAMNEICERHGIVVVSDEIHCDLVWPGHTQICFGTLNENAVVATAPSKTFNLAGLQTSNVFIKNAALRNKLKEEIHRSGYSQLNTLGLVACQSAYTQGAAWLEEAKAYIAENIRLAREFLTARLPKIKLIEPEGTYLLWLDFSAYGLTQNELDQRLTESAKLWLSTGTTFGQEGEGFQRMNIACTRATLTEALRRLEKEFK